MAALDTAPQDTAAAALATPVQYTSVTSFIGAVWKYKRTAKNAPMPGIGSKAEEAKDFAADEKLKASDAWRKAGSSASVYEAIGVDSPEERELLAQVHAAAAQFLQRRADGSVVVPSKGDPDSTAAGATDDAAGGSPPATRGVSAEEVDFWALCCLRARKYNVPRAVLQLRRYLHWRQSLGLGLADLPPRARARLRGTLAGGAFRWIEGARDVAGRAVLHIRLRLHDPSRHAALDVLRALHFLFERALRASADTQRLGVLLIHDIGGAGIANLDPRMPHALGQAFSKRLPVRLGAMAMLRPPWFFRIVFPVAKHVMTKKLVSRLRVLPSGKGAAQALLACAAADQLPEELNESLAALGAEPVAARRWDWAAWVAAAVPLAEGEAAAAEGDAGAAGANEAPPGGVVAGEAGSGGDEDDDDGVMMLG